MFMFGLKSTRRESYVPTTTVITKKPQRTRFIVLNFLYN